MLLLVIRVYFALSPSYLHPDENFQGPEVVAGKLAMPFISSFRPHPPSRDRGASASVRLGLFAKPTDGGLFRPVLVADATDSPAGRLALTR